jgi:hypothetical protein
MSATVTSIRDTVTTNAPTLNDASIPAYTSILPHRNATDRKDSFAIAIMSNLMDAEAGTERFGGYEAELKLVQADLSQQIEQIKETTGEPRKAAISRAERALEEADELVSPVTSGRATDRSTAI